MKSPIVSRETYEEALSARDKAEARAIDALAEVKAKAKEIAELTARLAEAERQLAEANQQLEERDLEEPPQDIRSHLGIRAVVLRANEWARQQALQQKAAAGQVPAKTPSPAKAS